MVQVDEVVGMAESWVRLFAMLWAGDLLGKVGLTAVAMV